MTGLDGATWVGSSVPRFEDDALLRGRGRFLDDFLPVPGVLHAAVVRSPFAHARVGDIDTSVAASLPGVFAVVTGSELAAVTKPLPAVIDTGVSHYAAAVGEVRYVGEPVAVVVARDRYIAEDAAALVMIDYEPVEPVTDLEAGRVVSDRSFTYGDADGAMADADLVVGGRYRFPRWTGSPIETFVVVADWNQSAGSMTAWANFQGPFTLHMVAAAALGLPGSRLRLITPGDSGGSFGVKAAVANAVVLIGAVSRLVGVPVKWVEDRVEHLLASSSSTERITDLEAGFSEDGRLLALKYEVIEDVGAYLRAPEPATLYRMHGSLSGAYHVEHVSARNRVVLTNRLPTSLNRGFGGPQLYFALESAMAIASSRLGIDRVELARRNLIPSSSFPYSTPSGAIYDSGDYQACLDDVLEKIGYEKWLTIQAQARSEGRLVGIGLGCVVEPSISNMGYISLAETAEQRELGLPKSGNSEGATISMSPSAGVVVELSTTPQGQGHRTVAAQVVADLLGLSPSDIEVVADLDTHTSAWTISSGNYSSRFSGIGSAAIHKSASMLAERLKLIAADELECSPIDVVLSGGRASVAGSPDSSISLRRIAGRAHWNPESLPDGMEAGLRVTGYASAPNLEPADAEDRIASSAAHGFVVDVAVVEVDRNTGQVSVLAYATTHDAGTLLNPALVEGQIYGGFAHGAGAALLERLVYDDEGNPKTSTLMDYLCITAPEVPPLTSSHIETPSPFTTLGAKGLGEGNTMSAPVVLANAVRDAIGIEDLELPLTAPRVWHLMESR
ncbi:MAG: xanthine dehydrogenase family protein molybdopterin-binding subunit [Acidimicrobiia bacterium]